MPEYAGELPAHVDCAAVTALPLRPKRVDGIGETAEINRCVLALWVVQEPFITCPASCNVPSSEPGWRVERHYLNERENIIHASLKPRLSSHVLSFVDGEREAVPPPVQEGIAGLVDLVCNLIHVTGKPVTDAGKVCPKRPLGHFIRNALDHAERQSAPAASREMRRVFTRTWASRRMATRRKPRHQVRKYRGRIAQHDVPRASSQHLLLAPNLPPQPGPGAREPGGVLTVWSRGVRLRQPHVTPLLSWGDGLRQFAQATRQRDTAGRHRRPRGSISRRLRLDVSNRTDRRMALELGQWGRECLPARAAPDLGRVRRPHAGGLSAPPELRPGPVCGAGVRAADGALGRVPVRATTTRP